MGALPAGERCLRDSCLPVVPACRGAFHLAAEHSRRRWPPPCTATGRSTARRRTEEKAVLGNPVRHGVAAGGGHVARGAGPPMPRRWTLPAPVLVSVRSNPSPCRRASSCRSARTCFSPRSPHAVVAGRRGSHAGHDPRSKSRPHVASRCVCHPAFSSHRTSCAEQDRFPGPFPPGWVQETTTGSSVDGRRILLGQT